jgi:hypothetical protein
VRIEDVTRAKECVMTVNQNDGEQSDTPPRPTIPPPSTTVTPWKDPFEYEEIRGGERGDHERRIIDRDP